MTDDFKKKLFDYITGNYDIESGADTAYVREYFNGSSNISTILYALSTDYKITGITNDISNNFIIYYGYYNSSLKGFILITDYKFQVLQLITQYSGGTNLPALYYLNYDENGNFFGLSQLSGNKYFLMLNNFCVSLTETFSVIFRQSYLLDGNLQNALFGSGISVVKKPNEAKYLFIMPYHITSSTIDQSIVSTLQINVGSSNEWLHTIYTTSLYVSAFDLYNNSSFVSYGTFNNDDFYIKIGGCYLNGSINKYIEYKSTNSGTLSTYTSSFQYNWLPARATGDAIILSNEITYVAVRDRMSDPSMYYVYKIKNNVETVIYSAIDNIVGGGSSYIIIKENNGIVMFGTNGAGEIGIIINEELISIIDQSYTIGIYEEIKFFITKQYNKYTYYLTDESAFSRLVEIYNSSNYNGLDYQSLNSMIPESSILYDESDKIVFARNLYNKVINGGTTTSTVEVPNNYLNDVNISKEELISETNSIMNSDTTVITKNIYEQLYINFINTLNVIDNNGTTQVLNPTGASRINDSISQTMDYDDTKIVKFVINYSDSTSDIKNFCSRTYSLTENRCTYTCIIYVPLDKSISNIQIKSNDGNTTYLTIDTSSLESGKYYQLSQDLVVE